MELSRCREAATCAATLELPSILLSVHESPPQVPILSQINPIHIIPSYLRPILILYTHLCLSFPSGLFPSGLPTNILYALLSTPFVLHALPISFSLT
jgi:hypothetical protein